MALSAHPAFSAGAKAVAPLLPGLIPFGMIAGIAAIDAGLSPEAALAMSFVIFAGTAQLVAAQLMDLGTLPLVIILTALVINARFTMYSASIAPHFQGLSGRWRWPLAYLLTDQAYALSITRYTLEPKAPAKHLYYLGAGLPLWLVWVASCAAGIFLGAGVPESWSLDFTIPLSFLVLLIPSIVDRATLAAALTGGVVAVMAARLPYNLGLFLAAASGIGAGLLVEQLQPPSPPPIDTRPPAKDAP
jgi:4-azaleucine resistance transporter AzlC